MLSSRAHLAGAQALVMLALVSALMLAAACQPEAIEAPAPPPPDPTAGLPPPTQRGARTGGMLIGGRPWVAQSHLHVHPVYAQLSEGSILFVELLGITASPATSTLMALHVRDANRVGRFPIVARVRYSDGTEYHGAFFRDIYAGRAYTPAEGTVVGELELTYIDPTNRIVAGRFHFRLPHPSGELVVTEGRFDSSLEVAP